MNTNSMFHASMLTAVGGLMSLSTAASESLAIDADATIDAASLMAAQEVVVSAGTLKVGDRQTTYENTAKYYPGMLSNSASAPTLLWRNTKLTDVVQVTGQSATTSWGIDSLLSASFWSVCGEGTYALVQFQTIHDGYVKVVLVRFDQKGNDVYAYQHWAKYSDQLSDFGCDFSKDRFTQYSSIPNPRDSLGGGGYSLCNVRPILNNETGDKLVGGLVPFDEGGKLVWRDTNLSEVDGAVAVGMMRAGYYYPGAYRWTNNGADATVQFQQLDGSYTKSVTVRLWQKGADVWAQTLRACYVDRNIVGQDMSSGYTSNGANDWGYAVQNICPVYRNYQGANATIVVKAGARLDTTDPHGALDLRLTEATHGKTIALAGDGPDGKGALYNSVDTNSRGSTVGHIVLADDASVGGSRTDLRELFGSATAPVEGMARLEGDHILTVKARNFNVYRAVLDVKGVVVEETLTFEGAVDGKVTEGIVLKDKATLAVGSTAVIGAGIPLRTEEGASANLSVGWTGGNDRLLGDVTVTRNSSLFVQNGSLRLLGTVAVDGILENRTAGKTLSIESVVKGSGEIKGAVVASGTWRIDCLDGENGMRAAQLKWPEGIDLSKLTIDVALSGRSHRSRYRLVSNYTGALPVLTENGKSSDVYGLEVLHGDLFVTNARPDGFVMTIR